MSRESSASPEVSKKASASASTAFKSFASDLLSYSDVLSEADDSFEILSKLLIVGAHGARDQALVPRVETIAEDPEDEHTSVSLQALQRMVPFLVQVHETCEGKRKVRYRRAAFEGNDWLLYTAVARR